MSDYKQTSDRRLAAPTLIALVAGAACAVGCSARTLVVVDRCPGGGRCSLLADAAILGDTSVPVDFPAAPELATPDGGNTLLQGLVGLWHFDEIAGSSLAMDSSGNGNHGTLIGLDPSSVWVPGGRLGAALEINGQGYVSVPLSPSIAGIVTGVTISAWVYSNGTVFDYGTALSRQIAVTNNQYYHLSLKEPAGDPSLFIATAINTLPVQQVESTPVPPQTWTHLAATYDGETATLYVDGTLVRSVAFAKGNFDYSLSDGSQDTTPVVLGGNGNGRVVTEMFPGRIDEIALYNRALDTSEILRLFNAEAF